MDDLDFSSLERWLTGKLPGQRGLQVAPVEGGQSNPTWFVTWGDCRLVLRKKPAGPILRGAHAVEREFRILAALRDTQVPVPSVLWLEEDASILGTPFYLMERLEGRVFSDCTLPGVSARDRREMYMDMARTMARMHALRPGQIGLQDYGRAGHYFERQIARWSKQYGDAGGPRIPALDALVAWMPENMPRDDGAVSIVHGDFRLGNMMFHPTEPKIIAVLDWELSTLGHPLADLGFCVMPWLSAPEEYGGILGTNWQEGGIPTLKEFVTQYYAHAVPTSPLTTFHMAFALFKFAAIFVGIADRARDGNAASAEAAGLGPLAERFALRARDVIAQNPPDFQVVTPPENQS